MFAGGPFSIREDREVIHLDQHDVSWRRFKKSFSNATGVDLSDYRAPQIKRRISSIASAAGETLDSLAERLETGPVLAAVTLHQVAIHTTQLFRDLTHWIELKETVLPELSAKNKIIRAWCAACANGAEAYSLASLFETLGISGTVLATDCDAMVLEQAVKGKFTQAQSRNAGAFISSKHFDRKGDGLVASHDLCRRIVFDKHNALDNPPQYDIDFISCRNLAIYLKDSACDKLYKNLARALRPGGYLFVGSTERLFSPKELGFEPISTCFYRKLRV